MSMLILKLFLAPGLVVASSLAGRRWGPSLAGTLVAMPIVAGPILGITCLEHGPSFAARAAGASLLGLVSLALFTVVFAKLSQASRTRHWAVTLLVAWAGCLAADLVLSLLAVPPLVALCLSLTATAVGVKALARIRTDALPPAPAPPRWDLPARGAATALLVTALTTAASQLGPDLTGVLAPSPSAPAWSRPSHSPRAALPWQWRHCAVCSAASAASPLSASWSRPWPSPGRRCRLRHRRSRHPRPPTRPRPTADGADGPPKHPLLAQAGFCLVGRLRVRARMTTR